MDDLEKARIEKLAEEAELENNWQKVSIQFPLLVKRLERIRAAALALKQEYEKQLKK